MSKSRSLGSAVAFAVLFTAAFSATSAKAVVYCKTEGVPQGCVVRPAPVVVAPVAPVARAAVVTPGAPVARAAAAPGVGRVGRVGPRR